MQIFKLALLASLLISYLYSGDETIHCKDSLVLNLSSELNSETTKSVENLFKEAGDDTYKLSMALLASGLAGDSMLYSKILPKLLMEMNLSSDYEIELNPKSLMEHVNEFSKKKQKPASFVAWQLGRVLVSADALHKTEIASKTAAIMLIILEDKNTSQDEFAAWAWGFLTTHYACDPAYAIYKDKMMQNISRLIKKGGSRQETTNLLWALVLQLQSAALAHDRVAYDRIIHELRTHSEKNDIIQAVSTIPADDYRAWALSLLRLAAARMGETSLFIRLARPVNDSINSATGSDKIIAILNNQLSIKQSQMENQAQN